MPSKAAHLIAFLVVLCVSVLCHRYVFQNWKRALVRDFPTAGPRLALAAKILFVLMDLPFAFLYFRRNIDAGLMTTSRLILFPFLVWQSIMFFWTIILVPVTVLRRTKPVAQELMAKWNRRHTEIGTSEELTSPTLATVQSTD